VSGHLEDCWDEPDPIVRPLGTDLEVLQGAWAFVEGRREAEFLFSGSHFTVCFSDGTIYMGSFELDLASRPRVMKMQIEEGPARHRSLAALCIYEIIGDTLRWCTAGPGQLERPAAFPPADDPRFLCLLFRRAKAAPRKG
jgi:uncharacterized protein (TIGR03067 family)